MAELMIRKAILDEITEAARDEGVIDYSGVSIDDLVGAKKQANHIMVREGETSKMISFRAVNLLSIGLYKPGWLAQQFQDRAPDLWDQYWQEDDPDTHPPTVPIKDYGDYANPNLVRPRDLLDFWAEIICRVEKDDVAEDHYERYYSQLYRSLVQGNHHTLRVGVVPWAEGFSRDGLVIRSIPKYVYPEDPEEAQAEDDYETKSAGDASW